MTRKADQEGEMSSKLRHRLEDCTEALLAGMQVGTPKSTFLLSYAIATP